MDMVFLKLLNMSIAAGWFILAVIILRFCFKKAPKWVVCLLWALVAVRLVCPFSVESALSLIPNAEPFDAHNIQYETPQIHTGVDVLDTVVNPILEESFAPVPTNSINPLHAWMAIAGVIWAAGVVLLLLYTGISYLRVYRTVREAVPLRENIYLCDRVKSPFILGVLRPRIFLSSGMGQDSMEPVIAHEKAHIARLDYLWKPLGFLLLTVYWFHPLCWLAYILLCRDIELACDEKVIRQMDLVEKKAYSTALLDCSVKQRLITVCPLAFGEVGVKERVKKVLNYKKPAFWMVTAAVIACIASAVCFLTNPAATAEGKGDFTGGTERSLEEVSQNYTLEEAKKDGCLVLENGSVTSGQEAFDRFLDDTKNGRPSMLRTVNYYELLEPSHYDENYYKEVKDEYPKLFVADVIFEEGKYKVLSYEEGQRRVEEFLFMVEDHFKAASPSAIFTDGVAYFLCDRDDATFNEWLSGLASSQFNAGFRAHVVYKKLNYK